MPWPDVLNSPPSAGYRIEAKNTRAPTPALPRKRRGLSHMEFSIRSTHEPCFVSRDISTSRPCERRDPYGEDSRFGTGAEAFFLLLRPGVMGPCVRRDDPLRTRAKPIVSTRRSIHPCAIPLPHFGVPKRMHKLP